MILNIHPSRHPCSDFPDSETVRTKIVNGQLVISSSFNRAKLLFRCLQRNLKLKLLFGHSEHDTSGLIVSKLKTNPEMGTKHLLKAESDPENGNKNIH